MNDLPDMSGNFESTAQTINRNSVFAIIFTCPEEGIAGKRAFILIERHDGKLGTPGGGVDLDKSEDNLAALIRELEEEINVTDIDKNDLVHLGTDPFTKADKPGTHYNNHHYGYKVSPERFTDILANWRKATHAHEIKTLHEVDIDPKPGNLLHALLTSEKMSPRVRNQIAEALEHYKLLPAEQIQKTRDMNLTPVPASSDPVPKAN